MKNPALALLLAATLSSAAAASTDLGPEGIEIELRWHVTAGQREVRLGEVAYVRTQDLDAIRRLVALPLGVAPRAGSEKVVRRDVIARWVRTQLGISRDRVVWTGADEAIVTGADQPIAVNAASPVRVGADSSRRDAAGPAVVPDQKQSSQAAIPPAPNVARGDWVLLQVNAGAVALERRTQALQDGQVGDTVRVRGDNGPIEARITAPGRVEAKL